MTLHKPCITTVATVASISIGLMSSACTGSADMMGSDSLTCEKISGTGTATADLSWDAPTQNSDDSAIPSSGDQALAGYIIYFGPVSGAMTCSININDPTATNYQVTDLLTTMDYTFAVTAYNNLGIESDLSNIVIKSTN